MFPTKIKALKLQGQKKNKYFLTESGPSSWCSLGIQILVQLICMITQLRKGHQCQEGQKCQQEGLNMEEELSSSRSGPEVTTNNKTLIKGTANQVKVCQYSELVFPNAKIDEGLVLDGNSHKSCINWKGGK